MENRDARGGELWEEEGEEEVFGEWSNNLRAQ